MAFFTWPGSWVNSAGGESIGVNGETIVGTVVRSAGGIYYVHLDDRELKCALRGKLKREDIDVANPVSIGDRVRVSVTGESSGVIEEILPRKSHFGRVRFQKPAHIIAANLDQMMVVFSANKPKLKTRMLDRFLVASESGGIEPVICINKIDLVDRDAMKNEITVYEDISYRVLYVSAKTGEGLEGFREILKGKVSALAGPSGTGKSTLLNAVQPKLCLKVSDVNIKTGKGRHTTSEVRLFPLDFGGYVADTPGIKTLALMDVDVEDIDLFFPEMRPFLDTCKFKHCSHTHEPQCGVKAALSSGKINWDRYDSYVRLRTGRSASEFEALDSQN